MPAGTLVIVNPQSNGGATGRRWKRVEPLVRERLGALEVEHTRAPRDAERIAREAVRSGVDRLVIAGGDGTFSEVVTGLLANELGSYARLGLLPLGTGGDLGRTLGIPTDLAGALSCIAEGPTREIDAGRVSFHDTSGKRSEVYFANVTSVGVSGDIVKRTATATRVFGGSVAFLISTLKSIALFRPQRVTLRVDAEPVYDGPLVLAAVANGRHFGGGMTVAPDAAIDDGWLDLVMITDLNRRQLVMRLPLLYRGIHIHDSAVQVHRGRVIEVDAPEGEIALEVDGEPLGTLPTRIEVLPRALTIYGPAT
jgi:YegS/Rv2252/BmrU family lipid kinase